MNVAYLLQQKLLALRRALTTAESTRFLQALSYKSSKELEDIEKELQSFLDYDIEAVINKILKYKKINYGEMTSRELMSLLRSLGVPNYSRHKKWEMIYVLESLDEKRHKAINNTSGDTTSSNNDPNGTEHGSDQEGNIEDTCINVQGTYPDQVPVQSHSGSIGIREIDSGAVEHFERGIAQYFQQRIQSIQEGN